MRKDIALIAAVLFLFSRAHATVWYVHPDSTLNSIQVGIDSAATGDTVLVGAGTYVENINFLGKAITVKSEYGPDTTIIDGSNAPNPDSGSVVVFVSGEDASSVLDGFTLTNGSGKGGGWQDGYGGGITCHYTSPTITNNIIIENTADCGGGILSYEGLDEPLVIINNIISNNAADSGAAVYAFSNYPGGVLMTNNTITGNTIIPGGDGGIIRLIWCSCVIVENIIIENTGGGVSLYGSGDTLTDNTITGNTGPGIHCKHCYYNSITNNTVTENTGSGIICSWSEGITIADNEIVGNGQGIFFNQGIVSITNNVVSMNEGSGIVLFDYDYCTASVTHNTVTQNDGSGITVAGQYNVGVQITDNTIADNVGAQGGGINIFGGAYNGMTVTATKNNITNNIAIDGGGVRVYAYRAEASVYFDQNTITGNAAQYGGGIFVNVGDHIEEFYTTIINNTITDNTSDNGGGIFVLATKQAWWGCEANYVRTHNNFITDNTALKGGGISLSGRDTTENYEFTITNNTITGNTADYGGGIVCADSTDATISYCTISANNCDGIYCEDGASPVVNYNNIMDNTSYGVRNVDPSVTVEATYNWWGNPSGPGGVGPGTGDEVSEWVNYADWFIRPVIQHDAADFEPNIFNKKRHGKWVTVYIELKDPYNPEDIDLSTVRLKGNLPGEAPAELKPTSIGDYDNDGIPDRMVKFKSDLVNEIFDVGDSVGVRITGMVNDSSFQVMDYIRVIEPGGPQSVDSEGMITLGLETIYPNPFKGNAAIRFSVSRSTKVTLQVFDISGRLVRTLIDRELDAGSNTSAWDGADDSNRKLPNGIYFLRFEAGDHKETKKLILLR